MSEQNLFFRISLWDSQTGSRVWQSLRLGRRRVVYSPYFTLSALFQTSNCLHIQPNLLHIKWENDFRLENLPETSIYVQTYLVCIPFKAWRVFRIIDFKFGGRFPSRLTNVVTDIDERHSVTGILLGRLTTCLCGRPHETPPLGYVIWSYLEGMDPRVVVIFQPSLSPQMGLDSSSHFIMKTRP
jgi:hypothetical protein